MSNTVLLYGTNNKILRPAKRELIHAFPDSLISFTGNEKTAYDKIESGELDLLVLSTHLDGMRSALKFRAGGITATIWKNQGKDKEGKPQPFNSIAIERHYTDKAGEWKSTSSFRLKDLPKVALVANKAYEYLVMKKNQENAEEEQPPVTEEEVN